MTNLCERPCATRTQSGPCGIVPKPRPPTMRGLAGEPPLIPMIGRYEGIGVGLLTIAHPPYQTASLLYDTEDSARPTERRHAGHSGRR